MKDESNEWKMLGNDYKDNTKNKRTKIWQRKEKYDKHEKG